MGARYMGLDNNIQNNSIDLLHLYGILSPQTALIPNFVRDIMASIHRILKSNSGILIIHIEACWWKCILAKYHHRIDDINVLQNTNCTANSILQSMIHRILTMNTTVVTTAANNNDINSSSNNDTCKSSNNVLNGFVRIKDRMADELCAKHYNHMGLFMLRKVDR
jgi:hypothetical protein